MKRIAFIFLLSAFLAVAATAVWAQPQITIPDSEFNFGYVPQHSKISHIFWLHSTGTDSLLIKKVSPG